MQKDTGRTCILWAVLSYNDEKKMCIRDRLDTEEDLKNLPEGQGTVVIRSHGVSRYIYDILNSRKVNVVDATCPFVKKIHNSVDEHSGGGEAVVSIGSPIHPEVEGIRGWGNGDTVVIENEADAKEYNLPEGKKLCIVSQTTFNYNKFQELVEKILKKGYDSSCLLYTSRCV